MTDWIQVARARGTPPDDVLRVAAILRDLELAFCPLLKTLPVTLEPAFILSDKSLCE